jgi:hypothetical protein
MNRILGKRHSPGRARWRKSTPDRTSTIDAAERTEAEHCVATRLPVYDVAIKAWGAVHSPSHSGTVLARAINHMTFGIVLAVMVAQSLVPFFNCPPFSKTRDPQKPGSCATASLSLWRYMSTSNVLTTLMVVTILLPALAKLQV